MKTKLRNIGRGIVDTSRPNTPYKGFKRVARLETGEEGLGPLLASSPGLAAILARACIAANMRDTIGLARIIHEAESTLDAIGWDWGDAETIINPKDPQS